MPTKNARDFTGGYVTLDKQSIEDNQLVLLKNFFYNANKKPQTRRGYTTFGKAVPDTVVAINELEVTTDILATLDAVNLSTGTAIKGANSVKFDIDVSNDVANQAVVTWTGAAPVNISLAKDSARLYFKPPIGFNTNLTSVIFKLGSDNANYYQWTLPVLTENTSNFIVLDYADAVLTGVPVDTGIDYFQVIVNYTAAYLDQTGVIIDWIYSYSTTATKPVTSWMFHKNDDASQKRTALCVAGTNMFEYVEGSEEWVVIDTGLSEFETILGRETERTRWDYDVYKNVFYMGNGVDFYRSYDGVTILEFNTQPKCRYFRMEVDRMFGAGDDENPSTLYYTANAPAIAGTINANAVVVGGDQLGKINGLHSLGNVILAGKDKKIHSVDIATPSALPIDARAGWFSDRSIANVGNSLMYFTDNSLETLKQRDGVSGSEGLESSALTDNLKDVLDQVLTPQYNANVGLYIKPLRNYYFVYDSNGDNIPDSWLVYSALTGTFSVYTLPAAYDLGEWLDSEGNSHYIFTSANGGQIFEFETGFSDNGVPIDYEITTKAWNFNDDFLQKDFYLMDISGLCSTNPEINANVIVDNEVVSTAVITDSFIDYNQVPLAISLNPLSLVPIGGGTQDPSDGSIDVYPYKVRIPISFNRGFNIQLGMTSDLGFVQFTLDRVAITYEDNSVDLFPYDNIA